MPEGDRFENSLGAGWRSAFRLVREGGTPSEVNDKLIESLAKTLRRNDGIPGFEAIVAVVESHGLSPVVAYEALDKIVRAYGGHRHTRIAADIAKSSFLLDTGLPTPGDMAPWVAVRTCIGVVDHYFFGRTRERLIAEGRLGDHAEAHGWRHQVIEAVRPRIEKIAHQLLESPDANGLTAPRRGTRKESTSDLLREELGRSPSRLT